MLRCSAGQDVKWSRSSPRKPQISEAQHTPNLTLLPTSSFSLPLPSLSVLSEKSGFSFSTKALSRHIPVCQSPSVQAGLAVAQSGPSCRTLVSQKDFNSLFSHNPFSIQKGKLGVQEQVMGSGPGCEMLACTALSLARGVSEGLLSALQPWGLVLGRGVGSPRVALLFHLGTRLVVHPKTFLWAVREHSRNTNHIKFFPLFIPF